MEETTTVNAMTFINFEDGWIVDSGCGHHLMGDASKFFSLENYGGKDIIITADNNIHPTGKKVSVTFISEGDPITLKNVYHVLEMKNLLSMANVVDAGYYILFGSKDVKFLRDLSNLEEDVIHIGKRIKDLFVLSASSSYVSNISINDGASIWHARLGFLAWIS